MAWFLLRLSLWLVLLLLLTAGDCCCCSWGATGASLSFINKQARLPKTHRALGESDTAIATALLQRHKPPLLVWYATVTLTRSQYSKSVNQR